jgi:hypothetical protein
MNSSQASNQSAVLRRVLAAVLALMMVLAFAIPIGMARQQEAYAASSDVYMMSYDNDVVPTSVYSYVLDNEESSQDIYVGPTDANFFPTYFDDYDDALNIAFQVVEGDGITGTEVYWDANEKDGVPGQWQAVGYVILPDDGSYGTVSIQVTNLNADGEGNYTNITIVRNPVEPVTEASYETLRVYDPTDILSPTPDVAYTQTNRLIVQSNDFPGAFLPESQVASAMDALYNVTNAIPSVGWLSNPATLLYPGKGDMLAQLAYKGTPYVNDDINDVYWTYGVYRVSPTAPGVYERVEIAKWVGADFYRSYGGDIVMWRYVRIDASPENFSSEYDKVFPNTLPI